MDRSKLAFVLQNFAFRLRDYPDAAVHDLFEAMHTIEERYELHEPLSEEDRLAIERSKEDAAVGRLIPLEEVSSKYAHWLKNYDPAKSGKDRFADAASQVGTLPGELQGDIASIIFTFLDEERY